MNLFSSIPNNYFLQIVFNNLKQEKAVKILKNNKLLQKRLNIGLNTYKRFYHQIEI